MRSSASIRTRENLDVVGDRRGPDVLDASVRGLHQAGAATGDHGVAGPAEFGTDFAHQAVVGVLTRRAGGDEVQPRPRAP